MDINKFNIELTIFNILKIGISALIVINLFIKISKQFVINNTFVIISILVILCSLIIDNQLSLLLFLLLLTILYNDSLKNVSFNLSPSILYYNQNETIEKYENNKVNVNNKSNNDDDDDSDDDNNDNDDDNNNNDNDSVNNNEKHIVNNEEKHIVNNEEKLSVNNSNNKDDKDDKEENKFVDYDHEKSDGNIENFEQPIDIKERLVEIEQEQKKLINENVNITQKTENIDLDEFISNSIYVPFEKLDSIQNNMITTNPIDLTQLDNSINEDYYNTVTNNRQIFVEKYIN
jgi:hypothetical protein